GAMIQEQASVSPHLVLSNKEPDAFGRPRLGGVGQYVAHCVEDATGIETRVTVLGHVQRGGTPSARDRVLALRYGVKAIDVIADGESGVMVALQADQIVVLPLSEATRERKLVDKQWLALADVFTDVNRKKTEPPRPS
ncbi:MAG TPA: 6-phosphofructokinase, partial [Myxococcota bacterium]